MIETNHPFLSVRRQCELLALNRSTLYDQPSGESAENLHLMRLIDEQYLRTPFYGRLVEKKHKKYPYLLRGLKIAQPNFVWSADITYIPMRQGFMYLVAVLDWFSRYVLSWQLSNTLDGYFCFDALQQALQSGKPAIFNTDQGVQFTANEFTGFLENSNIRISMDGRGRAMDNIFIERLWRTVKYEDVYLKDYATVPELDAGLCKYFRFYNDERLHQNLNYRTPSEVHYA